MHRYRLQLVPQAAQTAQGAEARVLSGTGGYSTMLGTAQCTCGPNRTASPRYTCVTCARFALIGRRIEAREAHRFTERRAA